MGRELVALHRRCRYYPFREDAQHLKDEPSAWLTYGRFAVLEAIGSSHLPN